MFLIGLVLLAAAIVVGVDVGLQNTSQMDVDAFGQTWTTTPAAVLVLGVIVGVVGLIGLMLLAGGIRRRRVRRREERAAMADRDRLAAERQRELDAIAHGPDRGDMADRRSRDMADREMADREMADREPVDVRDRADADVAARDDRGDALHRSR